MKTGTTFAGYRVEATIGRGGMGVVYRATDLSLKRPVALKLIASELAEDERFRARFLREPRLAASLDHPHVIPIYEAGEQEGQLYLAMRFVEGEDLKSLLAREGKLSSERTLAILVQIADALDAAHRRGLVHRDVKPANVLLDEERAAASPAAWRSQPASAPYRMSDGRGRQAADLFRFALRAPPSCSLTAIERRSWPCSVERGGPLREGRVLAPLGAASQTGRRCSWAPG
jgi:serine/threonine protein kinase